MDTKRSKQSTKDNAQRIIHKGQFTKENAQVYKYINACVAEKAGRDEVKVEQIALS